LKYSFIVPTYNRAKIVVNTLDSVLKQKYKNYEIIVVDDASTDNTREVISKYIETNSCIKYLLLDKNSGANIAKNTGSKYASGEYLIFLDSDDKLIDSDSLSLINEENLSFDYPKILMFACKNLDNALTINNINFTGLVGYKEYFKDMFKGEYLPVVNRELFYNNMFFEDINGGEGITWKRLSIKASHIYISSTVVRLYDNTGIDRLSFINKKNCKRIRNVFVKDLRINFFDYLNIYPQGIFSTLIRIAYYSLRSI